MVHHCDMRFPGGRDKALTFSYDDGVKGDIRLLELFKKYGVKGTFNLNSGRFRPESGDFPVKMNRRLSEKEAVELFADAPEAEVACHSLTHGFLERVDPAVAMYETVEDRRRLEKLFGRIVRGMAYPFGTFSDTVLEVLKLCGITYSRTTRATHSFRLPQNWLLLDPTCHHNDPELMNLAERFVSLPDWWDPMLFHLWGHSYEFEAQDNWDVIEKFAEYTGGHDDIWYATNIEIYDYVMAYERLLTSIDGSLISNPSAIPVWFRLDKEVFCVNPGETISVL